jgi:hypothetical protein
MIKMAEIVENFTAHTLSLAAIEPSSSSGVLDGITGARWREGGKCRTRTAFANFNPEGKVGGHWLRGSN